MKSNGDKPAWRKKFEEMFPDLIEATGAQLRFAEEDGMYGLWTDLLLEFQKAYESTPRNENLI